MEKRHQLMEIIRTRIHSLGLTTGAMARVTELAVQELDELNAIEQVS